MTVNIYIRDGTEGGKPAGSPEAKAAIERVREVCADQCFWAEHGPDAGLVNAVTVESILDALEGDSEQ